MRRIVLIALAAAAVVVPATASASGGPGVGGVHACAAAYGAMPGQFAPVTSVGAYNGPPGPFGGPNSVIDWGSDKNNGTSLIDFCQQPRP